MTFVQTVRGPIDTGDMGTTLMHEHVLYQFDDARREPSIELAVRLLRGAQEAGVRTIVDLTYLLHHLCAAGYADRVLISVDCNWTWDEEGRVVFEAQRAHPETARRTYAYMMTDAVPALLEAGFTEGDIHTFLVENPRRFFERAGRGGSA